MTRSDDARAVAVFDAGLPTGIAAVRSLGRAGVPIRAFDHARRPPGRYSRYVQHFERCPETTQTEEFTAWLRRRVEAGEISLVAPTSDYVTYAVALIERELGVALSGGVGGPDGVEAVLDCLFKHRFAERFSAMAFATPACADPVTLREALVRSRNVPTIRLASAVGTSDVAAMAKSSGIDGDIPTEPSMALGTASMSPLELAVAAGLDSAG